MEALLYWLRPQGVLQLAREEPVIFKRGSARQQSLFENCLTCGKSLDAVRARRPLYSQGANRFIGNRFIGYVHFDCSTPDWYPGKRP